MTKFEPGKLIGEYKVESWLASGGMGDIYIVWHTRLERREAMKVLKPELAENAQFVNRFLAEARRAAGLDHKHIIPIFQISQENTSPIYFTMKIIEGQSLKDYLAEQAPLSEQLSAQLCLQICDALGYAHENGIIHRDLKPANLMLDHEGHLYLLDFGIARAEHELEMTATGTQMGTATYMSPEQSQDVRKVDGRSDLYALGIILYEMLTGDVPFKGNSAVNVALQHVQSPIPDAAILRSDISQNMLQLIQNLLQKSPEDRYPDARALKTQLKQCFDLKTGPLDLDNVRHHDHEATILITKTRPTVSTTTSSRTTQVSASVGMKQSHVLFAVSGFSLLFALGIGLLYFERDNQKSQAKTTQEQQQKLDSERLKLEQERLALERAKLAQKARELNVQEANQYTPTQAAAAHTQTKANGQGLYPFTSTRYVNSAELDSYTCQDLTIMRNEIFARYGRSFTTASIRNHFKSQPWYQVNHQFSANMLSPLEKANASTILETEKNGGCY